MELNSVLSLAKKPPSEKLITEEIIEKHGLLYVDKVGFYQWNGINPRACIGQSERGEILMLVVEGRQMGRSIGTDVETCAKILKKHEAYTAMNLDGGTSAVMWYNGEYVTKCSNTNIQSRNLPNAWVYGNYE